MADTLLALAALSQATRLEAFRALVRHVPEGIAAGDLARMLAVPQNTLSSHLGVLTRAGLAHGVRDGRTITYYADLSRLQAVVLFLLRDCCQGRADICAPLVAALTPCCSPKELSA